MVFHLAWGVAGAKAAAERGDAIAVIDALRFTSASVTAVHNGFTVIPAKNEVEARSLSIKHHAAPGKAGICALSPRQFIDAPPLRIVLPSPHGATVCCEVGGAGALLASFLNAQAAAKAIARASDETGRNATIIVSGEIGGDRRANMYRFEADLAKGNDIFCFEDYACAGCVSSYLPGSKSLDLQAAEGVYLENKARLVGCIRECVSGRYLSAKGFDADVDFCARLNPFTCVPRIVKENGDAIIVGD